MLNDKQIAILKSAALDTCVRDGWAPSSLILLGELCDQACTEVATKDGTSGASDGLSDCISELIYQAARVREGGLPALADAINMTTARLQDLRDELRGDMNRSA